MFSIGMVIALSLKLGICLASAKGILLGNSWFNGKEKYKPANAGGIDDED